MSSPNATIAEAEFSSTDDPCVQIYHYEIFLKDIGNQLLYDPNLYHRLGRIFRLITK